MTGVTLILRKSPLATGTYQYQWDKFASRPVRGVGDNTLAASNIFQAQLTMNIKKTIHPLGFNSAYQGNSRKLDPSV